MKHNYGAFYQNVKLRPLERKDIECLRIWRNDSTKTQFLRRIEKITPNMQEIWYNNYLLNSDEFIFAIEETEKLCRVVGSVALYNFKNEMAELGRIQIGDDEAHGLGIGKKSLVLTSAIGIYQMKLKKIVSSVHQENMPAYKNNMKVGFIVAGSHAASMGGIEDEIVICEKRLREVNEWVSQIVYL